MPFDFLDEERMLLDLVDKFVENELMPLEKDVMARESKVVFVMKWLNGDLDIERLPEID